MKKIICALGMISMLSAAPIDSFAGRRKVKHVHSVHHGMSHKAKGTLVGAGSGAVIGGLMHGGKGAAIGGVTGAGVGYLIGRHEDRKHPYRKTVVRDRTVVRRR